MSKKTHQKALAQLGVRKEDVNYINAHATSIPASDLKEYQALVHSFGQNQELRVNSTIYMIGHLLGAAGALGAVATVQAIRTCWIHPNINLENSDYGEDTNVLEGPRKESLDVKVALSNSFGSVATIPQSYLLNISRSLWHAQFRK